MLDRVRHTNTLFPERRHSWPSFPKKIEFLQVDFPILWFIHLFDSLVLIFFVDPCYLTTFQMIIVYFYCFVLGLIIYCICEAWRAGVRIGYYIFEVLDCYYYAIFIVSLLMQLIFFFYFLLKCYCVCDVVLYNIFEEKKLSGMCWYWLESNQERCQSVDLWLQLLCFSVHIWLLWWSDVLLYTTVGVTAVSGLSVKMCPAFWDYFQCPCFMFN